MSRTIVASVLTSAFIIATTTPAAADPAYLYAVGQKSGPIKGSVMQKGREDSILVTAMSHSVVSPRDPQSGLPTGQRIHKPFVITKELDKATPILYNVLCTNENLKTVTIKVWTPQVKAVAGSGSEIQSYTVKLTNASIASIDFRMLKGADGKETPTEDIGFTYQKIEWTWNDGGITAMDDWQTRQ